jgi:hypothetical protein
MGTATLIERVDKATRGQEERIRRAAAADDDACAETMA